MNPVAGWYADPVTPTIARYWDGASWTEHTAPLQSPPAPETQQSAEPAVVAASPYQANNAHVSSPADYGWDNTSDPTYVPVQSPIAYPTPPPPQPRYVVAVPPKNSKATRALVWGIISLVINPFALPSILAIVFGVQARSVANDMERAGLPNHGRGRATAAIVVGAASCVFFLLWVVLYLNRN